MQSPERDRDELPIAIDESTEEGPALRDATRAAMRIEADEAGAAEVRELFSEAPLPALEPDDAIAPLLGQGEQLHDLRRSAILSAPGGDRALGYGGSLYLTSRRLVHLGQVVVSVQLTDITETSLAAERLLLSLHDGEGLAVDVDRPRTFRAGIAAALRALRR